MKTFPAFLLAGAALASWLPWARNAQPEEGKFATNSTTTGSPLIAPPKFPTAPLAALEPATRHVPPVGSLRATRAPVASLPEQIAQLLRRSDSVSRDRAQNQLLPQLLAQDSLEAARLIETWPPGALRDELLGTLARHWSASDLRSAMAWLSTLADPERSIAAIAAVGQLRQADPGGALAVAEAFQVGVADGQLEHIAQLWTEDQPAEAIAWVTSRPPSPIRDRLLARLTYTLGPAHPADAVSLLPLITAGPARAAAIAEVLHRWRQRDPVAADAWQAGLP